MARKAKRAEGVGASRRRRRWADLPEELLALTAERLYAHARVDFLRFCATCRSWRSAARTVIERENACNRSLQVPKLFVSELLQIIQKRFHPFDKLNMYTLYLVRIRTKCWVAQVQEKRGENKMHVERLTKRVFGYLSRKIPQQFNILKLHISEICKYYILEGSEEGMPPGADDLYAQEGVIKKISVISSRSVAGEFAAVGLFGNFGRLALFKSSREGIWSSIGLCEWGGYEDVVDYNGRFYAVHRSGKLLRIDVSSQVTDVESPIVDGTGGVQKILVESAGDLLLLDKYIDDEFDIDIFVFGAKAANTRFKVYKLVNEDQGTDKLVEIQSLGGRALFLPNRHCSYSLPAKYLPGCTPNGVYLREQFDNAYRRPWLPSNHNHNGMFNLEDGTYKRIHWWGT